MELIIILALAALIILAALLLADKKEKKSPAIKKDELINQYKNQMREVLQNYSNSNELSSKKSELLKEINLELSTNIFFDKDEIKALLKELLEMK